MNKKQENKAFCIAPWTHTFISPQSERRLCCASREEFQFARQYLDSNFQSNNFTQSHYEPVTLEEYWNGDFIKSIRKKMLKGEVPDECSVCHEKELTLSTYQDYFTNDLFPHLIEEAIQNTKEDGSTTLMPRSFDYRFDNTCNFSCRMCGDQLSSRWEKEKINHNLWNLKDDPWLEPELNHKIKDFQSNVVKAEFNRALMNNQIEEIYWVGGEPLLWDIHWKSMSYLVSSGNADNTIIRYNTNLSKIHYDGMNLFDDLLIHFKKVILLVSIDGSGEIGEYIRTGLNWKKWKGYLQEAKQCSLKNKNIELALDITLTLPGLFSLKEMILLANELEIPIYPKLVYAFDPTIILSPLSLPRDLLNNLLNELIKFNILHLSDYTKGMLELLIDIKQRKTHEEKYPNDFQSGREQGKKKLLQIESIRKDSFTLESILSANPQILNWWRSI
ncbi:twitch domain-containing radical SAM protein [Halobacteriovorax marinus]|uniref:twitch domain-containing radical SAM protein n=1 Tax=Halobacteriovorax marinus TaxID=97084 RepID=UPI003A943345